jgi:hypothetical protein
VTSLLHYNGPPVQAGGPPVFADATRYQACSGAIVFDAGSFQFTWGLDSFRDPAYAPPAWPAPPPDSPGLQRMMTNAIRDLLVSHVPHPGPPEICVPRASFSVSPSSPRVGQRVRFVSRSSDRYGFIGRQRWWIGAALLRGARVTRRFTRPGRYRVKLRAFDTSGASRSVSEVVRVRPAAPAVTRRRRHRS